MATPTTVIINSSAMGSALSSMLTTNDDIQPGSSPGYELCKTIYQYHPLGAKLVERPIEIAQSQEREISVPDSPESRVVEAFKNEQTRLGVNNHIRNVMRLARVYGVASLGVVEDGKKFADPLDFENLFKSQITFNVYDPLNTAGSLVLHQDPLAIDFQHVMQIAVNGQPFHRSRSIVVMNEEPIYISYTSSAFGFVGRSVYQRSLFPLKSFLQCVITDDLVARKVGVLVAKIKQPGSIINNAMIKLFGQKRAVVKEAETGGVISISPEEDIASLNFQNADGPYEVARKNIMENIASAAGMPAKLLTEETFAEGFGEGTEDAKAIARYIDSVRTSMQPLYDFFDRIVMYRAWNPNFYKIIQSQYPEYKTIPYQQAFYRWKNSFSCKWPSLLTEPDSELVKVDEVRLRAVMAWVQLMMPIADPDNKARVIEWAVDNFNALKFLFDTPLVMDYEELANYEPPQPAMGMQPPGQKPGQPGQQPGQGGQKQNMMGGMGGGNFATLPKSHANDEAVAEFTKAVSRMLESKGQRRLKLIESKREK
jgi:hypothetical protein